MTRMDGRRSILTVLYHRTSICFAVALFVTLVSTIALHFAIFGGRDIIRSGWSPLRGENVYSFKAVMFVLLIALIFSGAFSLTMKLINNYIMARTGEEP